MWEVQSLSPHCCFNVSLFHRKLLERTGFGSFIFCFCFCFCFFFYKVKYVLKEISPGCSLEGMMLKMKLQYFGHLMRRVDSLEKTLMLRGIGGRKKMERQRMRWPEWHHWLDGRESEWTPGVGDGQGGLACWFMGSQRVGHNWVTELNWTEFPLIIHFSSVLSYKTNICKNEKVIYVPAITT